MTLLLDTHVLIWLVQGSRLKADAVRQVDKAAQRRDVRVSVVSAWEVGLLAGRRGVDFGPDPKAWFARAVQQPGVRVLGLTAEVAIDASLLPRPFHPDPADRLLVATARHHDLTLVTRDRRILAYAEAGHLRAMPC